MAWCTHETLINVVSFFIVLSSRTPIWRLFVNSKSNIYKFISNLINRLCLSEYCWRSYKTWINFLRTQMVAVWTHIHWMVVFARYIWKVSFFSFLEQRPHLIEILFSHGLSCPSATPTLKKKLFACHSTL